MTAYAPQERAGLCRLLTEVGPDAPTLCGDWTTADLAAHLIARERRPDSGPGLLLPTFRGWTESVRRGIKARYRYDELVAMVANPPWWSPISNPVVDESANLVEFFVHHEDVRRARSDWSPRPLPAGMQRKLWRRLGGLRVLMRRAPATITLAAPGYGEYRAGTGGAPVRITGTPAELVLFCFGRQRVAAVEADGPDHTVDALRTAQFGI